MNNNETRHANTLGKPPERKNPAIKAHKSDYAFNSKRLTSHCLVAYTNDVINDAETILSKICDVLKAHEDRYNGVIVDIENMQKDASRFAASLKASLSQWAHQGKKAIWIKVPKEQVKLVHVAIEVGFWYHHAEPSYVMLVNWIPQTPPTIPDNASHQVGITAFVFNKEGEIDTEFVQVVGFRDGHNAPFKKSDLLFVCMLRSVSSNIVVQDTKISAAKVHV
ncbi:nudix hydrolase 8-like [Cryptomeria japonica]|uniref:nudix hydrolase 8-like n=1 Tax=Cryptomeria japonica TaxID=3369 RepID=UPI0027DA566C|nr:nudix hydrolase 8-like [Cryptomeria japonica]XP_059071998.1 nudix hydrolase 8-like [Cryptomeria japonica]XP_059072000.1 nudix hydrolase 8-like [Cryptomeria japonica]XP_059072062.1 nudix hydrolase 8-like [Cryptomeria japonica]